MKNKTTAVLLAFFLGGFGAHHFYLNRGIRGIIYFSLTAIGMLFIFRMDWITAYGIFGIVGLISIFDIISIVSTDQKEFDKEFNPGLITETKAAFNAEDLEKLFDLKQKGAITEAEYEKKKNELLSEQQTLSNSTSYVNEYDKKSNGGIYALVITGVIVVIFLIYSTTKNNNSSQNPFENVAIEPMQNIYDKVAKDAEEKYGIAKLNGNAIDAYVQAGMVAAAYLQAKDEVNYQKWKDIEAEEARLAGVGNY